MDYEDLRPTLKVNRRYCPHCDRLVSFKTFKAHKRLHHFDQVSEYTYSFKQDKIKYFFPAREQVFRIVAVILMTAVHLHLLFVIITLSN